MTLSDARGRTKGRLKPLSENQIAQLLADGVPPLDPHLAKDLETSPWMPSTEELPYSDEDLLGCTTPALRAHEDVTLFTVVLDIDPHDSDLTPAPLRRWATRVLALQPAEMAVVGYSSGLATPNSPHDFP